MAEALVHSGVIYALTDPVTGSIRYVGKTTRRVQRRWREHLALARRESAAHSKLRSWILSCDVDPGYRVLEPDVPLDHLDEAEKSWIRTLRDAGVDLCNFTDGGDGWPSGVSQSCESNEKRRQTMLARGVHPASLEALARARESVLKDPELLARRGVSISKAKKGKPAHNKREWTSELRAAALEAYSRMSAEEAAKEIGVGRRAMFEFLRAEGVTRKSHEAASAENKKHSPESKARMSSIKRAHHARGDYRRRPDGESSCRPGKRAD